MDQERHKIHLRKIVEYFFNADPMSIKNIYDFLTDEHYPYKTITKSWSVDIFYKLKIRHIVYNHRKNEITSDTTFINTNTNMNNLYYQNKDKVTRIAFLSASSHYPTLLINTFYGISYKDSRHRRLKDEKNCIDVTNDIFNFIRKIKIEKILQNV